MVLKLDPIFDQEFEGRRVLVRKRAYEVPVAVPALTVVVAYPVQKPLVRRILPPVLPLIARAATQVDIPPGAHAVSADVDVLIRHDHGGSVIECRNGRRESRGPRSEGDEIGRQVPIILGLDVPLAEAGQRGRADPNGCTFLEEVSPTDVQVGLFLLAHACILPVRFEAPPASGSRPDRCGTRFRAPSDGSDIVAILIPAGRLTPSSPSDIATRRATCLLSCFRCVFAFRV